MSRAWTTRQAVVLVLVTGLVVVTAMAAVASPALDRQHPAKQSEPGPISPSERPNRAATNASSNTFDPGWNTGRANPANTNYINTTGPTNPITTRWTFATTANTFTAGPVVVNGTVYFGTKHHGRSELGNNNGKLYAVDAWTGEERWTFQASSRKHPTSIAVFRNTVYVGTRNGEVHALDAATGDEFWTFRTSGRPKGLKVTNGVLYVISKGTAVGTSVPDGRVYALGALRGEEKWAFTTDGPTTGLAVNDGTTYVTTWSGSRVYALDAATGTEDWNVELDGWLSAPVVANGIVHVGTRVDGNDVYALDAETGNQRWKRTIQGVNGIASPSVSGNAAYFSGKQLHAVNPKTGTDRWTVRNLKGTPVLLNDIGYVRTGGTLYTLNPGTGANHARFTNDKQGASFQSGMAVLNGSLYVGYGFNEQDTGYDSDHTAFYALGTPEFKYTNLSVTPQSPEINESMTATVTVRNTGTGPGMSNTTLVVNGNLVNTTTAELAPRTSRTVTLAHTFPQNGTYAVEIGGLTRTITVGDVAQASTPMLTPTSDSDTGSPTQRRPSGETATSAGSDNTATDGVTPTPTSGTAPGFRVGVWVGAVALVAVLARLHRRE